jgi:hypothetical protein
MTGNEFIFSVLANAAWDGIKSGAKFSALDLKEKLRNWLFSDKDLETLAEQIYLLYEKNFATKEEVEEKIRQNTKIQKVVKKVKKVENKQENFKLDRSPNFQGEIKKVIINYPGGETKPKKFNPSAPKASKLCGERGRNTRDN